MSIDLKYFVLKPRSKHHRDQYASASRNAMLAYSDSIKRVNPKMADELLVWVAQELAADIDLGMQERKNNPKPPKED